MNIVIVGTVDVWLVTGVGFASLGNSVTFIDLDEEKINNLIELLQPYRISEISRTGKTAISKGSIILKNIKN